MFCRAPTTGLWAYAGIVMLNPLILHSGIRVAPALTLDACPRFTPARWRLYGAACVRFRRGVAVREDPLDLLSRQRLRHFLGAAARPFRVVLIDTPAAERGPDLEMFAALAGGALLVVRPGEDAARLARLRRRLTRCAARPVATVFNQT